MFIATKELAGVLFDGGAIPPVKIWPLAPVGYTSASAFFERHDDGTVRYGTKDSSGGDHEEGIGGRGWFDENGLHVPEEDVDVFYAFIGMLHVADLSRGRMDRVLV